MEFVELLKEAELLDFGQNFNIARPELSGYCSKRNSQCSNGGDHSENNRCCTFKWRKISPRTHNSSSQHDYKSQSGC
jgi:hypothetical protein